jgi:pimeloyl-ACP methyl ester carboxylesterase
MDVKRGTVAGVFVALLVVGGVELVTSCAPATAPQPVAVQWGRCAQSGNTVVAQGAQCGDMSVPLDHAKPDGARITIAVARLPATGFEKIGSLLINPGGPGAPGVDYLMVLADFVPAKVRERFDIVGFDPRGVGLSRPAVDCNTDAEDDQDRADVDVDYSPAGVAQTEQEIKDYVQRCVDKAGGEFLANVGTESAARDMDLLRAALGDDKLTYLGFSYGTFLGSEYAELFPERVRAMVLDGAVDPAVEPRQMWVDQAEARQKAFDDYAADCARVPDCPLGTDPSKAVEKLHSLIDPLVDEPAPTEDPRGLSYPDALTGVMDALYAPDSWEQLTAGLAALRDRMPADDLLTLADEFMVRDSDGHYDNSFDAFHAVDCADFQYPTDAAAWVEYDKKYRAVSTYDSYGEFTGHAPRHVCAFWPVRAGDAPDAVSVPGLPRTLVISTTGDPATPYLDGVHLAEQMHAALLTVEGTQHTAAFYEIPCIDDIVTAYLIDLTLPPPDKRCSIGS